MLNLLPAVLLAPLLLERYSNPWVSYSKFDNLKTKSVDLQCYAWWVQTIGRKKNNQHESFQLQNKQVKLRRIPSIYPIGITILKDLPWITICTFKVKKQIYPTPKVRHPQPRGERLSSCRKGNSGESVNEYFDGRQAKWDYPWLASLEGKAYRGIGALQRNCRSEFWPLPIPWD